MKAFIVGLAVVAFASADVSHLDTVRDADGYHYKQPASGSGTPFSEGGFGQLGAGRPQRPQQEYLPPGSPNAPNPSGPFGGAPGAHGPSGQPTFGGPGDNVQRTTPSLIHKPQHNAPGAGASPQFGSGPQGCGSSPFGGNANGPCGGNQPGPSGPAGPSGPTGQGPEQQYLPPSAAVQSPFSPSSGRPGSPSYQAPGSFGPSGSSPSYQAPGSFGPSGSSPSYQAPGSFGPGGSTPSYQAPGSFGPSGGSPSYQAPGSFGASLAGGRNPSPTNQYIPPSGNDVEPAHTLKEDGYHYKNPNY